MICILFVYFFSICDAKIIINIKTAAFQNQTEIKFSGNDAKLVTDKEILLFNVTKHNLNRGLRVELGKAPDDIYFKDPTPYYTNAQLFRKYKWPEVRRKLVVKNATILEFIRRESVLYEHYFINNSNDIIRTRVDLTKDMENVISFTWFNEGLPEDEIYLFMDMTFVNGNWTFVQKWRSDKLASVYLPMNTSNILNVENSPGNGVISKLSASKIIMLVEIEFQAYLIGNIIADYENLYGKYHFYSPSIQNIMKAGKIKNEVITKSLLELQFYADPKMQVFDKNTGEEIVFPKKPKQRRILKLKNVRQSNRDNKNKKTL